MLLREGDPKEFQEQKGSTYETRYIYTGMGRYDTEKKTIGRLIETSNGRLYYHEFPCTDTVFSRAYHTELVRVTVYSEKPRIWKEEVSPHEVYFFQQQD